MKFRKSESNQICHIIVSIIGSIDKFIWTESEDNIYADRLIESISGITEVVFTYDSFGDSSDSCFVYLIEWMLFTLAIPGCRAGRNSNNEINPKMNY